eukprot:5491319-Amphidinium_carterae.1
MQCSSPRMRADAWQAAQTLPLEQGLVRFCPSEQHSVGTFECDTCTDVVVVMSLSTTRVVPMTARTRIFQRQLYLLRPQPMQAITNMRLHHQLLEMLQSFGKLEHEETTRLKQTPFAPLPKQYHTGKRGRWSPGPRTLKSSLLLGPSAPPPKAKGPEHYRAPASSECGERRKGERE